jgi:hypothetical protein
MKRIIRCTVAGLFLAALPNFVLAQEGEKKPLRKERQEMQQKRINEGVKSGELTKKEAMKLERKQGAIADDIREARKSGGVVTKKEKAKIQVQQNKASEQIYKEKHDEQKQKKQ